MPTSRREHFVNMYKLFIFSFAAAILPFITANPVSRDAAGTFHYISRIAQLSSYPQFPECHGQEVLKQTYIGQSNDVLASYYTCSDSSPATSFAPPTARSLEGRTNECSAPCTTTCYTPSGGGPNPNDCTVVADALLYESQNTGLQFSIGPAVSRFASQP